MSISNGNLPDVFDRIAEAIEALTSQVAENSADGRRIADALEYIADRLGDNKGLECAAGTLGEISRTLDWISRKAGA